MTAQVNRYHPALVVLHWLLAVTILMVMYYGSIVLGGMENKNPGMPTALIVHGAFGITILVLTFIRLAVRASTAKPPHMKSGKPALDKLAIGVQHLLYTLTVLTVLAGLALAYSTHLYAVLFQHHGSLPKDFDDFATHTVHSVFAYSLLGLICLHVAGALQHQFVLKDGILSRMSLWGKK